MGIAGHPDVKTPFLDTLAARGHCLTEHIRPAPAVLLREQLSIPGFRRKNTVGLDIRIG